MTLGAAGPRSELFAVFFFARVGPSWSSNVPARGKTAKRASAGAARASRRSLRRVADRYGGRSCSRRPRVVRDGPPASGRCRGLAPCPSQTVSTRGAPSDPPPPLLPSFLLTTTLRAPLLRQLFFFLSSAARERPSLPLFSAQAPHHMPDPVRSSILTLPATTAKHLVVTCSTRSTGATTRSKAGIRERPIRWTPWSRALPLATPATVGWGRRPAPCARRDPIPSTKKKNRGRLGGGRPTAKKNNAPPARTRHHQNRAGPLLRRA